MIGGLLGVLGFLQVIPASGPSSSTPFVATPVDVMGLVIYFTMAALFLSETLL